MGDLLFFSPPFPFLERYAALEILVGRGTSRHLQCSSLGFEELNLVVVVAVLGHHVALGNRVVAVIHVVGDAAEVCSS